MKKEQPEVASAAASPALKNESPDAAGAGELKEEGELEGADENKATEGPKDEAQLEYNEEDEE